jgi:hypothetical protein
LRSAEVLLIMLGLESLSLESNGSVVGLVAFFVVNVIINLFLINKIFEERQRNRKLTRQKKDEDKIVREFLEQQHQETRTHNRRLEKQVKLDKEVIYLRTAYMKIEGNAIAYKVDTDPYWSYINEQLKKVIKAAVPQLLHKDAEVKELQNKITLLKDKIRLIPGKNDDPKVNEKKERIVAMLDNFSHQHVHSAGDRNRLKKQVNKIQNLVQLFEDPEMRRQYTLERRQKTYLKSSQKHLNKLQDNHLINENNILSLESALEKTPSAKGVEAELRRFKDENGKLNLHVDQLKKELREFQERMGNRDTPSLFIETNPEKKSDGLDPFSLSDEILSANEKEIDRLRNVITNQRRSIVEMEESLENLQGLSKSETSGQRSEIEKLQRCIQESEVCISMLEQELDELKKDLDTIRQNRSEAGMTLLETGQLDEELNTIKADLEKALDQNQRGEAIIEFVREALNASSVEDISLLIYENITSLNYLASLIVKAPERFIEMAQQSTVSTRDKVLINNMQFNEVNPGRGGQLAFRFLNIAGLVRPALGEEIDSDDQTHIVEVVKIADRIIGHLAANQKVKSSFKVLDNTINTIKQTSYELDKMLEDSAKKTKKLVSNNFGQVQDIARAKGLGASHIASFNAIEQETLRQLEAENTVRLKLRKQFLTLLNQLEN